MLFEFYRISEYLASQISNAATVCGANLNSTIHNNSIINWKQFSNSQIRDLLVNLKHTLIHGQSLVIHVEKQFNVVSTDF